jgi:hypothetical protein
MRMERNIPSHFLFKLGSEEIAGPAAADVYDEQKSLSSLRLSINKLPKGE